MGTMYDSCNPFNIPADAEIVMGYVDGGCAWSESGWARFKGIKVTISVQGNVADVLDVESGAATPQDIPGWASRMRSLGRTNVTVYLGGGNWPLAKQLCADAHVAEPDWIIAEWADPPNPKIPVGAVAHQYLGGITHAYDVSSTIPGWPIPLPPEPPKPQPQQEDEMQISWSPDGTQIAFGGVSAAGHPLVWHGPPGGPYGVDDGTDIVAKQPDNPNHTEYTVTP